MRRIRLRKRRQARSPHDRTSCSGSPAHCFAPVLRGGPVEAFFARHTDPRYDLWRGGEPQSNSDKPWLWRQARGEAWAPGFEAG